MPRQAVFRVVLTEPNPGPAAITVSWATVPDTAVPPTDYTTASGILSFGVGEIVQEIAVTVRDDDPDQRRWFTVSLSDPIGAVLEVDSGLAVLPARETGLPGA